MLIGAGCRVTVEKSESLSAKAEKCTKRLFGPNKLREDD
jgi:hypothetical protein